VPGLDLIEHARHRFDVSQAPFARYRELTQAVLEDGQDRTRPYELVLELLETFVVRRSTAQAHLDGEELRSMLSGGLVREARSQSGENVYVIRLPELSREDPAEAAV